MAAGKRLLDADGRRFLDITGRGMLSTGDDSVCPCCGGKTPICCQVLDCCFDWVNGRIRGHFMMLFKFYASGDASGPVLHTLLIEFDFDIPIQNVAGCGFWSDTFRGTSTPEYYSNIVIQLDGVDSSVYDVNITIVYAIFGTSGTWAVMIYPTLNYDWLVEHPLTSFPSFNIDGTLVTVGDGIDMKELPGDCLGIDDVDFTDNIVTYPHADVSSVNSIKVTSHLEMGIFKNYCCRNEESVCQGQAFPQIERSGACI